MVLTPFQDERDRALNNEALISAHPIDPAMREQILGCLQRLETDHDVKVLFASESGSRDWGFASPDSDYDVRFIYVNRLSWYLTVEPGRDVIEQPISGDLDVNGWDLRKTLMLLRQSNPTLLEWLRSPIVYREVPLRAAAAVGGPVDSRRQRRTADALCRTGGGDAERPFASGRDQPTARNEDACRKSRDEPAMGGHPRLHRKRARGGWRTYGRRFVSTGGLDA